MGPQVSVLLPAYNEADNLAELVPEITKVLEAAGISHEVLVVDDGSTDGTRGVMAELRGPTVRYVRLRCNSGKSAALAIGIEQVQGEFVALMDADGNKRLLMQVEPDGQAKFSVLDAEGNVIQNVLPSSVAE